MNYKNPHELDMYAFYWSEAKLVVAAAALFLGGVPPVYYLFPSWGGIVLALKICWIVSGIAALYLGYRWYSTGQSLFGHKDVRDKLTFFVLVISGVNLGLTGLLDKNIGMSIWSGQLIFIIVGALYLFSAWHLLQRWNSHGKKLF